MLNVICFMSVYHTNVDSLCTTQKQSLIWLDISCIFSLTEQPWQTDACLIPLWKYKHKVSLKDTVIHCPVKKPNWESTTLWLPTCALIQWAALLLIEILALTVFPMYITNSDKFSAGMKPASFPLLFSALTDWAAILVAIWITNFIKKQCVLLFQELHVYFIL